MSSSSSAKKAGRGKAWTTLEDMNLCKGWIKISEDPITGSGQKQAQFWSRVQAAAKSSRSTRAMASRWGIIRHDVSKFYGLFEAAVKLNESGKNDENRLDDCLAIFPDQPWNKTRQPFMFLECWNYLKDQPKWQFGSQSDGTPSKKRRLQLPKHGEASEDSDDFNAFWGVEKAHNEFDKNSGKGGSVTSSQVCYSSEYLFTLNQLLILYSRISSNVLLE